MIPEIKDINDLGDEHFEKLIKTLLLNVIGKGVTPFTKGKDGGREAKYIGKSDYPSKSEQWEGSWIFQVKYSDINLGIDKARRSIKYLIDGELKKLESYDYAKSNACDNYIYITNVPFSGESEKGLHDYIAKKRIQYKIKNFDYWDGEKALIFINSYPNIRETFFPIDGIYHIPQNEIEKINNIYVQPIGYNIYRDILLKDKIVSIIGQPHVGKTTTAKYLANEIFKTKDLSGIFEVPNIDQLSKIPSIENSVIVFDDLFGDTSYEEIGRQSKTISKLIKQNYIIITSRHYIYDEAKRNNQLNESIPVGTNRIMQEGSYTSAILEDILRKHLNYQLSINKINEITLNLILQYKDNIINQIRFPHNLEIFCETLDNNIKSKAVIISLIDQSKEIEKIVYSWLDSMSENDRNLLFLCSCSKVINETELSILSSLIFKDYYNIKDFFNKNERIIVNKLDFIEFRHPSFKVVGYNFFVAKYTDKAEKVLLSILFELDNDLRNKFKFKLIFQDLINDLDISILLEIYNKAILDKRMLGRLLSKIVKNNYQLIFTCLDNKKRQKLTFSSFAESKQYLTKKEIIVLLNFLFKERVNRTYIDKLIVIYSYKIRDKLKPYLHSLDENKLTDLKLKINLLLCIGTKYSSEIFDELKRLSSHPNPKIRNKVYSAFNVCDYDIRIRHKDFFENLLENEYDKINQIKLKRILERLC